MAYAMKPLSCNPDRINGISERLIISDYENNHGGAVQARRWSLYCLQLLPSCACACACARRDRLQPIKTTTSGAKTDKKSIESMRGATAM
jgi:hypothetical protein